MTRPTKPGKLQTAIAALLEDPDLTDEAFSSNLLGAAPARVVAALIGCLERDLVVHGGWHVARFFLLDHLDRIDRPRMRRILHDASLSLWARTLALEALGPSEDSRARTNLDHLALAHLHTAIMICYAAVDPESAQFLTTLFAAKDPGGWALQFRRLEEARWQLELDPAIVYKEILRSRRLRRLHGLVREAMEAISAHAVPRRLQLAREPTRPRRQRRHGGRRE